MAKRDMKLQAGVSLIEVLVALFVLAFGMLGIAGMQTMAMKANQSAFERNAAVIAAYSMADRMRSNQDAARSAGTTALSRAVAVPCRRVRRRPRSI
jgi:type IV pilus assembly protein PilV